MTDMDRRFAFGTRLAWGLGVLTGVGIDQADGWILGLIGGGVVIVAAFALDLWKELRG